MKLEQQLDFRIKDLENLSATTLYTGDLPLMGPGGFGSGFGGGFGGPKRDSYGISTPIFTRKGAINSDSLGMYDSLKIKPSPDLTIRDFPNSGFQMHIHEGKTTKPSSLINYSRDKFLLSSYDAAMADGGKPAYDAMELLERINKICGIKDKD